MTPRSSLASRLLTSYLRGPDHPAKLRLVRWLGRRVCPGGLRTVLSDGVTLFLSPQDWIEYLLLRGASYEPLTLEFLTRNLGDGDGAVLAGVDFGQHAVVAARSVGVTGMVVGVEPQPRALARSRRNLAANQVDGRTLLLPAALGDGPGRVHMAWAPPDNPGAASLFDAGDGFDVDVTTIAKVAGDLGTRRFRLLLLDVQGYEYAALQGLGSARPEVMVVEIDAPFLERAGVTADRISGLLRDLGYTLHDLRGRTTTDPLSDLPERNLVAVHAGCEATYTTQVSPV